MKTFLKMAFFAALAVACGFALGRMTAPKQEEAAATAKKEYAVPPTLPKMEKEELGLLLETPIDAARIAGTALSVTGRAKAGTAPVKVSLKTSTGTVLMETTAMVDAGAGAEFGRFAASLTLDPAPQDPVTLQVSREGSTDAPIVRLISFGSHEAVALRAYFPRIGFAESESCGEVVPLQRAATAAGSVNRAALDELFKGPTKEEIAQGFTTAVPKGSTIKSVAADANGTVSVDISTKQYAGASGCVRDAILSQITTTLRQFLEVRDVIISIDGVRADLIELK